MKHPILKEEFKNPILKIDEVDDKPIGWQKAYTEAFHQALEDAGAFLFDDVANDSWDAPEQLGGESGGAFLAYTEDFRLAEHLALDGLLKERGWTSKQVKYEFDNGEQLKGALFIPPVEVTHREATIIETVGGVPSGPVIDAFLSVVGELKEGSELWQVEDEQVWIAGRITREQRHALKYRGWYNLMNNAVDGVVVGFDRWELPAHMLPPKGRRTARPEQVNPGTPDEQLARVLPEPLKCWTWDGNSVFAAGDAVQSLDFNARNIDFPNQCNALRGSGWRENITKDFSTGLKTYKYTVPGAQYMPADIWEALTLLEPRGGWYDEGRCVDNGNSVTWRKDLDERAYSIARSEARKAADHPCFSVLEGWDEITYTFKPGNGF